MKKVTKLRLKLLEEGLTQREVARRAGLKEGLFSLICNGRYLPTAQQRTRIAEALGQSQDKLFERVYRL